MKEKSSLKNWLYRLLFVCLIPFTCMILYLLVLLNSFSEKYDMIVENITKANAYNINFKEDMDYIMYIIVVNSERAEKLVDTERPHIMIRDARKVFNDLYDTADSDYAKNRLKSILKSLNTLEDRVEEIEQDALISGTYNINMERLDLNIRVLTDLIQDQIQYYIYYETTNLEVLREGIRSDVESAIGMTMVVLIAILVTSIVASRRIMKQITDPIQRLCKVAEAAGEGDFEVRSEEEETYEMEVLSNSFNHMVKRIGNLIEDIRVEQLNLRAAELKLLQEQINPHFLYNTLDAIIWLAESKDTKQVVNMVSSLSDFFRTTLSKGRDFISVKEEETHIRSYLEIQQFRYRDILQYEIDFDEELYQYQIIKLTLQPLVENALYHGIKNKRGLGKIRVTGKVEDGNMIFKVIDNGVGMDENQLDRINCIISGSEVDDQSKSGFGLFNVNQRIKLYYGNEYGLSLKSKYMEGTESVILIPCEKN